MKITDLLKQNLAEYTTDKFNLNKTIINNHNYDAFYNNLFENIKDDKLNILEIGIDSGGSLKLFHDYFINSVIYGIDIVDNWKNIKVHNYSRIKTFYFDAYDENNWNKLPIDKFDFIIDDGPHTYESQLFFLNHFDKLLNDNGMLILEDIPYFNLERLLNENTLDNNKIAIYNWYKETERFDDIIITYKK
jgi:hypothetical protein